MIALGIGIGLVGGVLAGWFIKSVAVMIAEDDARIEREVRAFGSKPEHHTPVA
jgi:hypothetical protein